MWLFVSCFFSLTQRSTEVFLLLTTVTILIAISLAYFNKKENGNTIVQYGSVFDGKDLNTNTEFTIKSRTKLRNEEETVQDDKTVQEINPPSSNEVESKPFESQEESKSDQPQEDQTQQIEPNFEEQSQISVKQEDSQEEPIQNTEEKQVEDQENETKPEESILVDDQTTDDDSDYIYGALTFFKMNHEEKELFKEKDIAKPDWIYNTITDYSPQRYEYQQYDPSVEDPHEYYRFSPHYYNITRTKHFSMVSLPSAPTVQDLFDPYTFVGFIKSRASSVTLRLAIRETFANMTAIPESEGKAKIYFTLGVSEPYEKTIPMLLEEQKKYNDLFIINIQDSYQNLTLKALIPEDIFVAAKAKTPYYILGDDDSCIKTRDLLRLLKTTPKSHYYAGKCVHNRIGETGVPHGKHSSSRLAMPFKLSFAIANLIVMSNDVVYSHIENVRHLAAYTHIDDGELGILSEMGKTSVQCPNFVADLRSKPIRGYAKTVPQYAIHYCKNGRIMKNVCFGINDYSIKPDPLE